MMTTKLIRKFSDGSKTVCYPHGRTEIVLNGAEPFGAVRNALETNMLSRGETLEIDCDESTFYELRKYLKRAQIEVVML